MGSSMLAMMRTSPPHLSQVSIYPRAPSLDAAHQFTLSILKTRFNRFAQVIEALFSAGVWSDSSGDWVSLHLPLIWTSPICKDSKLLRIELRLLAYIRLLSGEIQFPSPDGMRASTPFLLYGSREPCGQTGLSTSVQPIRHRLSSLQSWVSQYSFTFSLCL